MYYKKIEQLSWYMPDDPTAEIDMGDQAIMASVPNRRQIALALHNYTSLDFGHQFARTMAQHRLPLPSILNAQDSPVYRAYRHYLGHRDPLIDRVLELRGFQSMKVNRSIIEAWCVADRRGADRKEHLDALAQHMGISRPLANAYEKLFFNVIDRSKDEKFLMNVVYPDTRLVEFVEDYAQTVGISKLMLRSAYNNGVDHLLHMAGARDMYSSPGNALEFANGMESRTMANGLWLSCNGWMSQGHPVITSSRQLLAAAKAGGQGEQVDPAVKSFGELLGQEVRQIQKLEQQANLPYD